MIARIWARYDVFIKYCLIGASSVLLDLSTFSLIIIHTKIHYQIANIIGILIGIGNSFYWNANFNFKVKNKYFIRLLKFYSVGFIGLGISSVLLFVLSEKLEIPIIFSKITTIAVVTIIQFALNKNYSLGN